MGFRFSSPRKRRNARTAQIEQVEPRRLLSASSLDPTFNGVGYNYDYFNTDTQFFKVNTLAGGKTLAAGIAFHDSSADQTVIARYTSAGKLDKTFGSGKGWVGVNTGAGEVDGLVQLPGGKFAIAQLLVRFADQFDFQVVRFNADGSLDKSFGGGDGIVTTDFGRVDRPSAIAVTSDGKLVVAGTSARDFNDGYDLAVARYNPDGSLDKTFSGDGKFTSDAGPTAGLDQQITSVSVLGDGKILLGGSIGGQGAGSFYLARLTASGSFDSTFGGGKGYTLVNGGPVIQGFVSLARLSNGQILAGGTRSLTDGAAIDEDFAVLRFNANGSLDTSFGKNGFATAAFTRYGVCDDVLKAVLVQPSGKIVAAGFSSTYGIHPPGVAVARFNANGTLDTSFSGDGKQFTTPATYVSDAALDSSGRLVVVGTIDDDAGIIYRFGTDSSSTSATAATSATRVSTPPRTASALDPSFNGKGYNSLTVYDGSQFNSVTVLPNGKILAAGYIDTIPNDPVTGNETDLDFLVARYTAAGQLDKTFGGGQGWINTGFTGFSTAAVFDIGVSIVQLPGGKFAVAGTSDLGDFARNVAVARYNADGSLDQSFGDGGRVSTFVGTPLKSDDTVSAITVTSDNKLLVIGSTHREYHAPFTDLFAVRYNTNGSLDTSCSGDGILVCDAGTIYGDDPYSGSDDQFGDQTISAVNMLPSGGFLVAGMIADSVGVNHSPRQDLYLAKFTAGGALDTTFGAGKGYVRVDSGAIDEGFTSLAILNSGKILAGGSRRMTHNAGDSAGFLVARFNTDGSLDKTFGKTGFATTSFSSSGAADDVVQSLLVQPNGKIVAVGTSTPQNAKIASQLAVARFTAGGVLDTSFSGDGRQLSTALKQTGAAALDFADRIVVVGQSSSGKATIVRFGADAAATAQISGAFYNDKNNNGKKDAGEPALAGWQAYVVAYAASTSVHFASRRTRA